MSADDGDVLIPLAVELIMMATGGDLDEEFVTGVNARLDDTLTSQEDAYELIAALAAFCGITISEWADSTDRDPSAIMQAIGLDVAKSMYTDDDQ